MNNESYQKIIINFIYHYPSRHGERKSIETMHILLNADTTGTTEKTKYWQVDASPFEKR